MKKLLLSVFVIFCFSMLVSAPAFADGMIFPRDPDDRERFIISPPVRPDANFTVPLSVNKHHVKIDINNLAATTQVDQKFYNHENRVIEGLYIFPLPTGASIGGFSMDIEGKMTTGELLDADKAKKIYEDIVRQMRDPGLLEYMGKGVFKTRIYPIAARSEKNVKISYQEALKMEGGLVRYVYPLNIDRYSKEKMKDVAITTTIKSDLPIASVYSPTHKISINRKSANELIAGFEVDSLQPDQDFVLYYSVARKDISLTAINHRPDATEDGTFMLMLAPVVEELQQKTPKIDVALVMDTSGSMSGNKIQQARKALEFCINSLSQDSRFFLCNFATEAESYKTTLESMNDNMRDGALNFVKNLDAMGGTNISEALDLSIKALNSQESTNPKFMVFVTDGKPTAGETDSNEILKLVAQKNTKGIRIFTFGVGEQLNTDLIDKLAEENGGVSDYVSETEDLEIKISALFSKLTHPVLTDVSIQFHNVEVNQIYPRKTPDLFKDSNLLLLGRYQKPGAARITLMGNVQGKNVKYDFETDFPEKQNENAFVAKIWATRKIGAILDQIRKNGTNDELKNEIIALAKRYGILTPYTSYLVLEDSDKHGPDLRRTMVRDDMPSASFEKAKESFSMERLQTLSDGADAVGASREMNSLKMAAAPQYAPSSVMSERQRKSGLQNPDIRHVGAKTFYLIQDKWVDSGIRDQKPDHRVKAWSEAYFHLSKSHPELSRFLSLGEKLIVMFNGKVIEISPDDGEERPFELK